MNMWQYLNWQFTDSIAPVIQFFKPEPMELLALIPQWVWIPIIFCATAIITILSILISEYAEFTDMWEVGDERET